MRFRHVRVLSVVSLLLAAGCSSDGDSNSGSEPAESTADASDRARDVGTFTIVLEVVDPTDARRAAVALDQRLVDYQADDAVIDGEFVEATVVDVTEDEAEQIDLSFEASESVLEVRPVVDLDAEGAESLPTRDGETIGVGPAQTSEPVFGTATVVNDLGWELILDLPPEGAEAFNSIAEQCFAEEPTCTAGRIAVVFDGEVITAPAVNAPTFTDTVAITGQFTREEALELAEQINGAVSFEVTAVRTEFQPG